MVKKLSLSVNPPQQNSMNLREAAAYLGRNTKLIKKLADSGYIPCFRCQNGASARFTYFFSRDALDRWQGGENAGTV